MLTAISVPRRMARLQCATGSASVYSESQRIQILSAKNVNDGPIANAALPSHSHSTN